MLNSIIGIADKLEEPDNVMFYSNDNGAKAAHGQFCIIWQAIGY